MTATIVNLNKFRKARDRTDKEKRGQENRTKFGRTKSEKAREATEQQHRNHALDGAQIETARLDDNHDDLDPGNVS